jgi:hypothetical protein
VAAHGTSAPKVFCTDELGTVRSGSSGCSVNGTSVFSVSMQVCMPARSAIVPRQALRITTRTLPTTPGVTAKSSRRSIVTRG